MQSVRPVPGLWARLAIGLLALLGLAGVLPVSVAQATTGGACPLLGPVPACYLVSVAYGLVLLSVLHPRIWRRWLFLLGWLPIFAFAAAGSGLEVLGQDVCPKTGGGIPKCYLSLALAVAIFLPFLAHLLAARRSGSVA